MKKEDVLIILIPVIAIITGITSDLILSVISAIIYLAVARLARGSDNYTVIMLVNGEIPVITASSLAVMLLLQILVALLFVCQYIATKKDEIGLIVVPVAIILSAGAAVSATQEFFPASLILLAIIGGITFIALLMKQKMIPKGGFS